MNISISVDTVWLLSDGGRHSSLLFSLKKELLERWKERIEIKDSSLSDCQLEYHGDADISSVASALTELISTAAGQEFDENIFNVTIEAGRKKYKVRRSGAFEENAGASDLFAQINALRDKKDRAPEVRTESPAGGSHETTQQRSGECGQTNAVPDAYKENKKAEEEAAEEAADPVPSAYDQIQDLVGSKDFKKLAEDIRNTADNIIKHRTQSIFFSEVYLFSVDTGSGYHSSLQLLNDLLVEAGLFRDCARPESIALPSFNDREMSGKMQNAAAAIENALQKQRLISIDISEWLGHTHTREFKKLAMKLFRANDKCVVVFRIPYVRPVLLDATVKDLSDVISTRPVVFAPFDETELREIARRYLDVHDFSFTDKAWDVFSRQIEAEKADGYFYGIHTVHKLVGDIIRKKEYIAAGAGKDDRLIAEEIASAFAAEGESSSREDLDTLGSMIGMEAITKKVVEVVNQIMYSRKASPGSKPTMHMCFVGNPGTGKTTVARIIGNVLKEKGVLRIGKFYEHHGRDLCAEYVGQTAPKTHAICQEAYGSVLFIDEAYSLASEAGRNDYGREAIDTLITEMENHGDDLIVIFAGYPDEIARMIAMNPGMSSRIPYTIRFPNYTREQLAAIFMSMVGKHFACTEDLDPAVKNYFSKISDEVLNDKTFGNGRFVRNLFERTWGKAIARCSESGFDGMIINAEDFEAAAGEFDVLTPQPEKRRIGF